MANAHWAGPADGPYIHINDVIAYFKKARDDLKQEVSPIKHGYLTELIGVFQRWQQTVTTTQLTRLANKLEDAAIDPSALEADLRALKTELE